MIGIVWFDEASVLRGVSLPFVFGREGIGGRGLTPHPDGKHLLISYGVGDGEACRNGRCRRRPGIEDAEHLSWGKGCEALAAEQAL
jgi:hypothetical protein